MIRQAFLHRRGSYYYIFPDASLGRRAIWDGINRYGKKYTDFVPNEIIAKRLDKEMKIQLVNGSIIQIVGGDKMTNVGTNPCGIVFSEYSIQSPLNWPYIQPILKENGGWCIMNATPRGKNHLYRLLKMAETNEKWFSQVLTVKDTGALDDNDIAEERMAGMSEEMINQEYYCSFDASTAGAVYARYVVKMREENRICFVPYDDTLPVNTAWDIGVGDDTCVIFFQIRGDEIHIISYYQNRGYKISHYIDHCKTREWKDNYGTHLVPHDANNRNAVTGTPYIAVAADLGLNMTLIKRTSHLEAGIEIVRNLLPRVFIDEDRCDFVIDALLQYHFVEREKLGVYSIAPAHDWSSHCCDAIRTMCTGIKEGYISQHNKAKWAEIKNSIGYYDGVKNANELRGWGQERPAFPDVRAL
jgi:hypothetical protein